MNSVQLSGIIGQDPELKVTDEGKNYCKFSVAESYYDFKTKERATRWWRCTAWGTMADFISKNFTKKSWITLCGEVSASAWISKENVAMAELHMKIDRAAFCGGKTSDAPVQTQQPSQPQTETTAGDDIPF